MKNKSLLIMMSLLWVSSGGYANTLGMETQCDFTVEPYRVNTQLGVEGEEQLDQSTLIHGPVFDATFGIGEWAEAGFSYEILSLSDSDAFDDQTGSGDVRLHMKVIPVKSDWGNLGFSSSVKLPTATIDDGLGTEETDVVLKAIYGNHSFADLDFIVNLGVAIQGDPAENSSQETYFVWSVGARYPMPAIHGSSIFEKMWLIAEFEGAAGGETNVNIAEGEFNDGDAEFRGGFMKELSCFNLAVTGSVGITDDAPDWGFRIFLSRAFDVPVFTKE